MVRFMCHIGWMQLKLQLTLLIDVFRHIVNQKELQDMKYGQGTSHLSHMRVFGCTVHQHIIKTQRFDKLSPTSRLCVFIGYDDEK